MTRAREVIAEWVRYYDGCAPEDVADAVLAALREGALSRVCDALEPLVADDGEGDDPVMPLARAAIAALLRLAPEEES